METDILKLYIGCQCVSKYVDWVEWGQAYKMTLKTLQRLEDDLSFQVKPILRPLSSMTEEEGLDCFGDEWDSDSPNARDLIKNISPDEELRLTPNEFQYLLSKGFDLFGLIESGSALDGTKL